MGSSGFLFLALHVNPFSVLFCFHLYFFVCDSYFPASSIVLAFTKKDSGCMDLGIHFNQVLNQKLDGRRLTRFEARDDLSSLDLFVLE